MSVERIDKDYTGTTCKCRSCGSVLRTLFVDLGCAPPSNAYLEERQLSEEERCYPLRVYVCERCWLVQTEDFAAADELFDREYAYFSSASSFWLSHARSYVEAMVARFGLDNSSFVVEVASNDGYLLQYVREHGIPCLGIEPTASTASAARDKGVETLESFFGEKFARELSGKRGSADLMIANNVLAHVPDINDFVKGFAALLKPTGVATFEFPHLLRLVQENQFDTIYHEHFSYLSLTAVQSVLSVSGLQVFDLERLVTHGGSLRLFVQKAGTGMHARTSAVDEVLSEEENEGMLTKEFYSGFKVRIEGVKTAFVDFLEQAKRSGKRVGAYGAAAKGNTLLNYAGVGTDLLPWVVDRNPAKRGKYLPGSHIPIVDEAIIRERQPDYIVVLPWNIKEEIFEQLNYIKEWGGIFVTAVPSLKLQ